MLTACIILTFFAVSDSLTPKCDMTCTVSEDADAIFVPDMPKKCLIKTPQTNNCTFDISELIFHSCNIKDYVYLYDLWLLCDNTQYRLIITNEKKKSCEHYLIHLHVKKCGLLWQDLVAFGEFLRLHDLTFEDYEDRWNDEFMTTDYWQKYLDLRYENKSGIIDSQRDPVVIPHGLRNVDTLEIVNMDHIPKILQEFIWPYISHLDFTNTHLSSQLPHHFSQTNFLISNKL